MKKLHRSSFIENAILVILATAIFLFAGCASGKSHNHPINEVDKKADFINKVWEVNESESVSAGTLYVFLSDGTLVIVSKGNKPGIGSWEKKGDGLLVTEEGITYPVDVEFKGVTLSLTYHHPGGVTLINFVPARVC